MADSHILQSQITSPVEGAEITTILHIGVAFSKCNNAAVDIDVHIDSLIARYVRLSQLLGLAEEIRKPLSQKT